MIGFHPVLSIFITFTLVVDATAIKKEDVDGALGDGRLFNLGPLMNAYIDVDMLGIVDHIDDKNSCCEECKESYPDTLMISHLVDCKGCKDCICFKMNDLTDQRPSTSETRIFSGLIGNNSEEVDLDIGEGLAFDPLTVSKISPGDDDTVSDVHNHGGCLQECEKSYAQSKFFTFFQFNNQEFCNCYTTIPGVLPKTYAETYFSAICGNN